MRYSMVIIMVHDSWPIMYILLGMLLLLDLTYQSGKTKQTCGTFNIKVDYQQERARFSSIGYIRFHCWIFIVDIFIARFSLSWFHCQVFIARFSLPNFHCQIFIARFSLPGFLPSNLTYFSRNFSRNAQMPSCSQAYSIG